MVRSANLTFAEHLAKWMQDRGISRAQLLALLDTQERMLQAAERGNAEYVAVFEAKLKAQQKRVGEPTSPTREQVRQIWKRELTQH